MPTRDGYAEGIPCWTELATPDVDTVKSFYGALFGWEFQTQEAFGDRYTMAMRNGLAAAGIAPLEDGTNPSAWSTYFAVDDVGATAGKIEKAGGSLMHGPIDVGSAGRMALASDPTGAVFGMWEAGNHFGAAVVNEHGGLNWNELVTEDPDRALDFYATVFGHANEKATTPGGREYWMLKAGSREIAGVIVPRRPGPESHWTVYFAVDNADAAAKTAATEGGTVLFGPVEQPEVGTFVGLEDPSGAHITVIELAVDID